MREEYIHIYIFTYLLKGPWSCVSNMGRKKRFFARRESPPFRKLKTSAPNCTHRKKKKTHKSVIQVEEAARAVINNVVQKFILARNGGKNTRRLLGVEPYMVDEVSVDFIEPGLVLYKHE